MCRSPASERANQAHCYVAPCAAAGRWDMPFQALLKHHRHAACAPAQHATSCCLSTQQGHLRTVLHMRQRPLQSSRQSFHGHAAHYTTTYPALQVRWTLAVRPGPCALAYALPASCLGFLRHLTGAAGEWCMVLGCCVWHASVALQLFPSQSVTGHGMHSLHACSRLCSAVS
jgi:hypothetical protein